MKLSDLKVDSKAIELGRWVDDIPDLGDVRLKVRGLGNIDFKRRQAQLLQAIPVSTRTDNEETEKVTTQLLVETVLLDWEIEDLPFSKDEALRVLSDPDFRILRDGVIYAANVVARGQAEELQADAKN